jgi:nucleotide-binding universal stress UspA family protein
MKTDRSHDEVKGVCRVALAIDPRVLELLPDPSEVTWLKNWAKDRGCILTAVFVDNTMGQAEFSEKVRELGFGIEVEALVLTTKDGKRRKPVDRMLKYIEENKINFLIVSSHGRSGLNRLLMGSFAESLLALSPIPVLFLHQGLQRTGPVDRVLFPTDFSSASEQALELFLSEIPNFQGELIVYHADIRVGPIADAGMLEFPVYLPESYWADQSRYSRKEAHRIQKFCLSRGFRVRTLIQDGVVDLSGAIENIAKQEEVDVIAMSSTVAQKSFRSLRCPVWICGPEALERRRPHSPAV